MESPIYNLQLITISFLINLKKCGKDQMITNIFGDVIFRIIGVEPLWTETRTISISGSVLSISDIPSNITLYDNLFELKGIIGYILVGIGHYVAHVIRNNSKWYQFNNLS